MKQQSLSKRPEHIKFSNQDFDYTWKILSDELLGGKSNAIITQLENSLKVTGTIIKTHNTAFICLISNKVSLDLSQLSFIEIRIKTDGRPYGFQMEYNEGWQNDKLSYIMKTTSEIWQVIRFPASSFQNIDFKGISNSSYNPKILSHIYKFGFCVPQSSEGSFEFEIESISFKYNY